MSTADHRIDELSRVEFEETDDLIRYLRAARHLIKAFAFELEHGATSAQAGMAGIVQVDASTASSPRRAKQVARHMRYAITVMKVSERSLGKAEVAFRRLFSPELDKGRKKAKSGMRVSGAA